MTEQKVVKSIKKYLKSLEDQGDLYFIRNNTGIVYGTYKGKKRAIAFGRKGSADFVLFLKGGKTIFVECKAEGKKQTKDQKDFEIRINKLGYRYIIVYCLDDIVRILNEENIFPANIYIF